MSQGSTNKNYPAGIDTFITWEDDIDNIIATSDNDSYSQIIAIQTELGTDPAGSMTDVKTRLAVSIEDNGTLKATTVDSSQLVTDSVNETHIDLGNGANQVDHNTFGFQKATVTVTATDGTYSFDFTDEGLTDYSSAAYQVLLTPVGTNATNCWAVVSGAKATTGFTIALMTGGTNGSAPYNADAGAGGNVDVDVLTLHQV